MTIVAFNLAFIVSRINVTITIGCISTKYSPTETEIEFYSHKTQLSIHHGYIEKTSFILHPPVPHGNNKKYLQNTTF